MNDQPRTAPVEELRSLLRLAAPIAFTQAGYALMGLVDTAVVGRLGAAGLGAVGVANGLFFAVAVVGLGAMFGLDPLFAQALGARDRRRAEELIWQGLWLSGLVTLALTLPIAVLPFVLEPAGIPPEVARDGRLFLWLRLPGLWPMLAFAALRSYLQSSHRLRALVIATLLANVANFALDVLLVFGKLGFPALGAPGSALATSICSLLQFVVLAAAVRPGARRPPRTADLRKALAVGIPVGLQMGAEVGVFALVGLLAGRLGARSLAAHQVAISLASFTFCAAVGVGMAGTVRVGWAVGARDTAAARRSGLTAFAGGAGIMSLAALAFWLAPGALARMLTDQADVISIAIPLLAVCAVFQLSDGIQGVGAGVLRGAGDTRFAFLANLVGHYLVGLPVAILLGLKLGQGVIGLWWGLCAGLTAVAVGLLTRFLRISSREIVPLEAHPAPD
ncbi:MAG TPA: MATE family efflux transporter [Myxococcales bacterium]|nr:MATE family efflux transporter [Myxococcales bacterium]